MTEIVWALDMIGINYPKSQNSCSAPGIAVKGSDLHPIIEEVLKSE